MLLTLIQVGNNTFVVVFDLSIFSLEYFGECYAGRISHVTMFYLISLFMEDIDSQSARNINFIIDVGRRS